MAQRGTPPAAGPASDAGDWLDSVVRQGGAPPLLIVADSSSIASQACRWDRHLTAAGWDYRVRLGEAPGRSNEREAAAVAREAVSLKARAILMAGDKHLRSLATAAGRLAGLPLVDISGD